MPRVPYISREDLAPDMQGNYDRIANARGGRVPRVLSLALNSPEAASRLGDLGAYVRFHSQISDHIREITILAAARELNCQYEFTHHEPLAREVGVRELVIEGIKNRTTKGMIPQESVFIDYAKQVLRNRVNDPTFAAIEHLLGRQGAVDLTVLVGYYALLAHVMEAMGVELEEGEEPLLPEGDTP